VTAAFSAMGPAHNEPVLRMRLRKKNEKREREEGILPEEGGAPVGEALVGGLVGGLVGVDPL
jgi:hypothetical protein